MSGPLLRPTFLEGQVLAAADLEQLGARARLDSAIHERSEHTWGIAQGLEILPGADKFDDSSPPRRYIDPELQPGVAITASGRRIVVTERTTLRQIDFRQSGVFSSTDNMDVLFPVFLVAVDVTAPQARALGPCQTGASTRTQETFQIRYGRPGAEKDVLAPTAQPAVDAPPDTSTAPSPQVLIGFVAWDRDVFGKGGGRFHQVATASGASRVRYAGVRASSVVGHTGTVAIQTSAADPRFVLSIAEDSAGGCKVSFGRQQGSAAPSAVFTVDEKGNLTLAGKLEPGPVIAGAVVGKAGAVVLQTSDGDPRFVLSLAEDGAGGCKLLFGRQQGTGPPAALFTVDEQGDVRISGRFNPDRPVMAIGSGFIFHGLTIPLPPGITPAMVAAGDVTLHVSVRPLLKMRPIGGVLCYPLPLHCTADADRVVTSYTRWVDLGGNVQLTAPSTCEYQVIAVPT